MTEDVRDTHRGACTCRTTRPNIISHVSSVIPVIFSRIKVHNNNLAARSMPAVSRSRDPPLRWWYLFFIFAGRRRLAMSRRVLSEESDCDERGEFHPVARSNEDRTGVGNNTVCH